MIYFSRPNERENRNMSVHVNGRQISTEKVIDAISIGPGGILIGNQNVNFSGTGFGPGAVTIIIQNCEIKTVNAPQSTVSIVGNSKVHEISTTSGNVTVNGDINSVNTGDGNITCYGKVNNSSTQSGVIAASSTLPNETNVHHPTRPSNDLGINPILRNHNGILHIPHVPCTARGVDMNFGPLQFE